MKVDVGCAACIYQMPGIEGCGKLAANIDGKPVLVEGANDLKIHASGLCGSSKQAQIVGEMRDGSLVVTSLTLDQK